MITLTITNGNKTNKILGSIIRIKDENNVLFEMNITTWDGIKYISNHPYGDYSKSLIRELKRIYSLEEYEMQKRILINLLRKSEKESISYKDEKALDILKSKIPVFDIQESMIKISRFGEELLTALEE